MSVQSQPSAKLDWCRANFQVFEKGLNGQDRGDFDGDFHRLREDALKSFLDRGFPTTKEEDWRYTNVAYLTKENYGLSTPPTTPLAADFIPAHWLLNHSAARVVFVDGTFVPSLSDLAKSPTAGVSIFTLEQLLRQDGVDKNLRQFLLSKLGGLASSERQAFDALNTAFLRDAVIVHLARGARPTGPIESLFISTDTEKPTSSGGRVLVVLEDSAEATLSEMHFSKGTSKLLKTVTTEIYLGDNASLEHVKVINENNATDHFSSVHLDQGRDSRFRTSAFFLNARLVRSELLPTLNGSGGNCEMHGLTIAGGEQLVDNFTALNHAQPHCESSQLFKGIYAGKSRGVFCGTITVQQIAQKTNAFQKNASILLSDEAAVDTKPQLKIWADDVKCTHGATVGQLDEEALFYLRSRGIARTEAQKMLVRAFADDVTSKISDEKIHEVVGRLVGERLNELHI